ncbi:unknown [Sutterella wadsworthensis CAG:135]|nr:unknown [Sutterella wadsworthensis CAG:135]
MRRIELAFFLVGINGERPQEIFIDTPYQVFLMEALFTDFVDFVNKCFERFPFNAGLRKKLHRERASKTFDRRVEIRNHQIDGER